MWRACRLGSMRMRAVGDALTILLASALGLVVEIVAGRLLAPYVGMSLYSWTAIIAVVLGGFSLGHWWGGWLAGPRCDRARGHLRLAWLLAGCAGAALLAVPALRLAAPYLDTDGAHPLGAIVGFALAGFFAPSLFVGAVSPIVTKLAAEEAPSGQIGRVLGRFFALSIRGKPLERQRPNPRMRELRKPQFGRTPPHSSADKSRQ